MPPLNSTTARDLLWLIVTTLHDRQNDKTAIPLRPRKLNAFHRRIPNELVQLKPKPGWHVIGDHPLREFARIEKTVRCVAAAARFLAKCGRKQHGIHPSLQ